MLLARPVERGRAAELACPFLTATGDLALRMLSDSPPMLLVVLTALVFFRRTLCAFAFGRAGVPVEVAFTLAALALSLCTAFCSAWACRGVTVGLGLGLALAVARAFAFGVPWEPSVRVPWLMTRTSMRPLCPCGS